jgi:hypothetical protein
MSSSSKFVPYFKQSIGKYFPDSVDAIMNEIETAYSVIGKDVAFASVSSNPMDKRLGFSAYFLSLIKVLSGRGENFEKIRVICLEIAHNYVRPKNGLHLWFKRLLPKLIGFSFAQLLLKEFAKRIGKRGHPDGFVANLITDKKQTFGLGYGVDIVECGICKLFKKHNFAQYSTLLCEVDEVTSGLAGLQLIRSSTIARGAHHCDFRWKLEG